ncbi:hypothetical protein OSH10_04310 [Kaistia defluvii]|uniref:hypothetical protein n=1 Tax=Kaistia defluvii TaxID=410841 RepID=UPI00225B8C3A|nr:hypothetical protein [Kaistia defluvii]MCX5517649.1 hypothetical protein [Kaistia defluvii]
MPQLRISPEGIAEHFWLVPDNKPAFAIEPDDLDLSDDLLDRIEAWGDAFDAVFDPANPPATRFASPEAEIVWRAEGHAIAAAIREELGDDWDVETRF